MHRKCRVECIGEYAVDEPTAAGDLVGDRRRYLGNQRIAERILRLERDSPAAHQFGDQPVVGLATLQDLDKLAT